MMQLRIKKLQTSTMRVLDKASKLKKILQDDVKLNDEQYMEIMQNMHEYEKILKEAEDKMKKSQGTLMAAHDTALEVLKKSGEIKISDERFNVRGQRKYECLFCSVRFDTTELRRHHIYMHHWKSMDQAVSKILFLLFLKMNNILDFFT